MVLEADHQDRLVQALRQQIARLEAQLVDLQTRLPAHSLPPALQAQMDDLDEALAAARSRLQALENPPDDPQDL